MEYLVHIAILIGLYSTIGLSMNLLIGETGLVSVAQAAFAGIGAYGTAIILVGTGVSFLVAVPCAIVVAVLVALVVGIIFLRLKEVYYVFGTIGLNVIVWSIFLNWDEMTRGPLGIPGIPRPELFGRALIESVEFLALVVISALFVWYVHSFIVRSSFGRVLNAIREDEAVAAVFGYSITHYKLMIFCIAAAIAALSGSLYAMYITYIDPSIYTLDESVYILAIAILGGLASARGVVVGAVILVIFPEALRFIGFPSDVAAQLRLACYGLVLVLFMLYRPQGLLGKFRI